MDPKNGSGQFWTIILPILQLNSKKMSFLIKNNFKKTTLGDF